MEEREIIKLAIKNNLFHLLRKQSCQVHLNEMLVNGEITNDNGEYYVTEKINDDMALDDFLVSYQELFSYKRTGIKGKSGDKKAITSKVKKFRLETGMTYQQILDLADYYVKNYKEISGFLVMAKYFLYKRNRFKSEEISWAKSILEDWKAEEESKNLFETDG